MIPAMSRVRRTIRDDVHNGYDVPPDDARARGALEADRGDEVGVAQRDGSRRGAMRAYGEPGGDRGSRNDRVLDPVTERGDERERQDQARKRRETRR